MAMRKSVLQSEIVFSPDDFEGAPSFRNRFSQKTVHLYRSLRLVLVLVLMVMMMALVLMVVLMRVLVLVVVVVDSIRLLHAKGICA